MSHLDVTDVRPSLPLPMLLQEHACRGVAQHVTPHGCARADERWQEACRPRGLLAKGGDEAAVMAVALRFARGGLAAACVWSGKVTSHGRRRATG